MYSELPLSAFAENLERELVDECEAISASADFAPTKRAEKIPLASASGASFSSGGLASNLSANC